VETKKAVTNKPSELKNAAGKKVTKPAVKKSTVKAK
jgi:hypothetical protein